jgi:hypothetical protein
MVEEAAFQHFERVQMLYFHKIGLLSYCSYSSVDAARAGAEAPTAGTFIPAIEFAVIGQKNPAGCRFYSP